MNDDPLGDEGLDIGLKTMARTSPGYRVSFEVRPAGDLQNVEFRLEVDDAIRLSTRRPGTRCTSRERPYGRCHAR
jgi:hypothetical protein